MLDEATAALDSANFLRGHGGARLVSDVHPVHGAGRAGQLRGRAGQDSWTRIGGIHQPA
jgi:hypothetical protein